MYEISSTEMTFTNEYYDDGNLMTSAEYDEGKLIETGYCRRLRPYHLQQSGRHRRSACTHQRSDAHDT